MRRDFERLERVQIELSVDPLRQLFANTGNRLKQLDRGESAIEPFEQAEPSRVCDLFDRAGDTRPNLW